MTGRENISHEAPAQEVLRRDSNLKLIASPLIPDDDKKAERVASIGLSIDGEPDVEDLGFRYRDDHDCPEFVKHSSSTNYELFYDLWFVANLEVFSSSKGVSKEEDLYSYIGYLTILWFTWFLVGMFDVRFVTDSIFERVIRTAHLGVMVGFSVVVTYFNPDQQEKSSFQTLSIILMVSRLVLVVQYGTIMWHIRRYKQGKYPIAIAAAVHFVAAMIFLGVTFRFEENRNSRVYIVWYIVAVCEAIIQLGLAKFYKVLTFTGTHLTERMTVLTVIILGGGVTSIAKNVVLIVKNAAGWTSATIGVLTSAIALMYCFFMLYFDWMNHHHLKGARQLAWSMLHFPFHVFLLLFMEGATQFMVWWKVHELTEWVNGEFNALIDKIAATDVYITSDYLAAELNSTVQIIFNLYPSTYTETDERVTTLLHDVQGLPQSLWDSAPGTYPDLIERFEYDVNELLYAIINSLFVGFKIDPFEDMEETDPALRQDAGIIQIATRYDTVFQYGYITAGLVLMLMTIMFALTRRRRSSGGWSTFVMFRTALFFLMGLGLSLVSLLARSSTHGLTYLLTPWLLPTICIVFFVVLLLTHLPHPPPLFFAARARGGGGRARSRRTDDGDGKPAYTSVQVQEVGSHGVVYDTQEYNPQRWGNASYAHIHSPYGSDMTYHNAYGQAHDLGMASPPAVRTS
ncbi:hypothetical protein JX265_012086 [Neoarthrinium moseri]|uniref:Low temperature requirement A n=1 Tax=Neoarthrinium moseri TaxID=1658444 RepID=A0A9P9WBA5_9PEZI|nr:hypothetical protein JX265_012086 [Neoarthrinium moseri]